MTKGKQLIYVKLHNDKVVALQVPNPIDDMIIQFLLNSKYGHMGWKSYKIKVTSKTKENGKVKETQMEQTDNK